MYFPSHFLWIWGWSSAPMNKEERKKFTPLEIIQAEKHEQIQKTEQFQAMEVLFLAD